MDHFESSSVSYLNPIEGIQFDGRSYALYGIINKKFHLIIIDGNPFIVCTNFTKNRLCDCILHFIQIRLNGSLLIMKVDKRQYSKTEGRIHSIDIRGPLFISGYSEKYSPKFLSVRTKS